MVEMFHIGYGDYLGIDKQGNAYSISIEEKDTDMQGSIHAISPVAETKDAALQVENGNKAAGTRARKASLAIEKALKEFLKKSIDLSK